MQRSVRRLVRNAVRHRSVGLTLGAVNQPYWAARCYGGTDKTSTNVVWTDWANSVGQWSPIGLTGTNSVTAENTTITVFIEHWHKWALSYNLTLLDDVQVTITGGLPEHAYRLERADGVMGYLSDMTGMSAGDPAVQHLEGDLEAAEVRWSHPAIAVPEKIRSIGRSANCLYARKSCRTCQG